MVTRNIVLTKAQSHFIDDLVGAARRAAVASDRGGGIRRPASAASGDRTGAGRGFRRGNGRSGGPGGLCRRRPRGVVTRRPGVLTRQARESLRGTAAWTADTFSVRQAAICADRLVACCDEIAAGLATTRDCRRLVDADLPQNLRVARNGQNVVVFVDAPDRIVVVDVIHARADLPRRLAALGD